MAVAAAWWHSHARAESTSDSALVSSDGQAGPSATAGKSPAQICSMIGFAAGTSLHSDCVAELKRRARAGQAGTSAQSPKPVAEPAKRQNTAQNTPQTTSDSGLTLNPGSRVYVESTQNATELDRILSASIAAVQAVDLATTPAPESVVPESDASSVESAPASIAVAKPNPTAQAKASVPPAQPVPATRVTTPVASQPSTQLAAAKTDIRVKAKPVDPATLKIDGLKQNAALWPLDNKPSNIFGSKGPDGSAWRGLVIKAAKDTPVNSIADGKVIFAKPLKNYGNLIVVDHGNNYMSVYAYNSRLTKQVGDLVAAGEPIATVGNTGPLTDMALYFEVRRNNVVLNPGLYLKAR